MKKNLSSATDSTELKAGFMLSETSQSFVPDKKEETEVQPTSRKSSQSSSKKLAIQNQKSDTFSVSEGRSSTSRFGPKGQNESALEEHLPVVDGSAVSDSKDEDSWTNPFVTTKVPVPNIVPPLNTNFKDVKNRDALRAQKLFYEPV